MVSRAIGSRPRCVILTVRSAVFICGETEVMVPWIMVPMFVSWCFEKRSRDAGVQTILQLNRDSLVRAFHEKPTRAQTVSLLLLDLGIAIAALGRRSSACAIAIAPPQELERAYLTSFMLKYALLRARSSICVLEWEWS